MILSVFGCNHHKDDEIKSKKSFSINQVVDSLLLSKSKEDTIDYNYYLSEYRDEFINSLIERMDYNQKIYLVNPYEKMNLKSSTIPRLESYVGVKAICFLNLIINDSDIILKKPEEYICKYCVAGLLLKDGSTITLNTLIKFKGIYKKWFRETKDLSFEEQSRVWNQNYWNKISLDLM